VRVAYSAPEVHELVAQICTHAANLVLNGSTLYRGDSIQAKPTLTYRSSMVSKS